MDITTDSSPTFYQSKLKGLHVLVPFNIYVMPLDVLGRTRARLMHATGPFVSCVERPG